MKRIKKLFEDHKNCWGLRKTYQIKWRSKCEHKDIPLCTFFVIPTIAYNTYPYRRPGTFVFNVYFLHWYLGVGEWVDKEKK